MNEVFCCLVYRVVVCLVSLGTLTKPTTVSTRDANDFVHAKKNLPERNFASRVKDVSFVSSGVLRAHQGEHLSRVNICKIIEGRGKKRL